MSAKGRLFALAFLLAIAFFFSSSACAVPEEHELDVYTFEDYIGEFGKRYDNSNEYNMRRDVFRANLDHIMYFNKNAERSYSLGVNQFTDLTDEEFNSFFNGRIPSSSFSSYYSSPVLRESGLYTMKQTAVPDAMTWQDATPAVLTAIKSQGHCGSCWAHAATEVLESFFAIQTKTLLNLSVQQITSCVDNTKHCGGTGGCGGGTVQIAWEYVHNVGGITTSEAYPYTSGTENKTGSCELNSTMPRAVYTNKYITIPRNEQNAVVEALVTEGPLAVSVDASLWKSYGGGIFDGCGANNANITINHAVQLVGYGSEKSKDNKTEVAYWIVRNSFGESWGEKGYIRLLRNKENETCRYVNDWNEKGGGCAGDPNVTISACGMCGILVDVQYPLVAAAEPLPNAKYAWIAGVAFGALGLLMVCLVIYSKVWGRKRSGGATLLDESESLN